MEEKLRWQQALLPYLSRRDVRRYVATCRRARGRVLPMKQTIRWESMPYNLSKHEIQIVAPQEQILSVIVSCEVILRPNDGSTGSMIPGAFVVRRGGIPGIPPEDWENEHRMSPFIAFGSNVVEAKHLDTPSRSKSFQRKWKLELHFLYESGVLYDLYRTRALEVVRFRVDVILRSAPRSIRDVFPLCRALLFESLDPVSLTNFVGTCREIYCRGRLRSINLTECQRDKSKQWGGASFLDPAKGKAWNSHDVMQDRDEIRLKEWQEITIDPDEKFVNRLHLVQVSLEWRDQGWGNGKGMIFIVQGEGAFSKERHCIDDDIIAEGGPAPHEWEELQLTFRPQDGKRYFLRCSVGGGSLNQLCIRGLEVKLLAHCDTEEMHSLLPIHLACKERKSPDVVRGLIKKCMKTCPRPLRKVDQCGRTPIHVALMGATLPYGFPRDIRGYEFIDKSTAALVLVLLDEDRSACTIADNDGRLPLHYACLYNSPLEVVQALVVAHPEAVQKSDKENLRPITMARERKAPFEVMIELLKASVSRQDLREIIRRYPNAAEKPSVDGKLLVHIMCQGENSLGVVKELLSIYPNAAKIRDSRKAYPLHCACAAGASPGVVQTLLAAYPEAAKLGDVDERLPIHYACWKESPLEVLQILVQQNKDSIHHADINGSFPINFARRHGARSKPAQDLLLNEFVDDSVSFSIHVACAKGANLEVVRDLIEIIPDGVQSTDSDGRLPIHHACKGEASRAVLEEILQKYPEGIYKSDKLGRLPIHVACEHRCSLEVVELLLTEYRDGARISDERGKYPIHFACSNDASPEVVRSLLQGSLGKGAKTPSLVDQMFPLHYACANGASAEVVRQLVRTYAAAASFSDAKGKLPIHYACESGASASILSILIDANHMSLIQQDGEGNTPLHIALQNAGSHGAKLLLPPSDALMLLLEQVYDERKHKFENPAAISNWDGENGDLPIHVVCKVEGVPSAKKSIDTLQLLVDAYPEGLATLDSNGNTPLHCLFSNAPPLQEISRLLTGIDRSWQLQYLPATSGTSIQRLLFHRTCSLPASLTEASGRVGTVNNNTSPPILTKNACGLMPFLHARNLVDQIGAPRDALLPLLQAHSEYPVVYSLPIIDDLAFFLLDLRKEKKEPINHCTEHYGQKIINAYVGDALNAEIVRFIPTFVLMADLYAHVLVVFVYPVVANAYINQQGEPEWAAIVVFSGAAWFLLREVLQITSLGIQGKTGCWLHDPWNVIDATYLAFVFATTTMAYKENTSLSVELISCTTIFVWLKVVSYLKSIQISFAVFISTVLDVTRNLFWFLVFLTISMVAFAQVFYFLFQSRNNLDFQNRTDRGEMDDSPCHDYSFFGISLFNVFALVLGQCDFEVFYGDPFSMVAISAYALLVIILLLNMLIAIVNHTYEDVRAEGKFVFWYNRMQFISETNLIKDLLKKCCGKWVEEQDWLAFRDRQIRKEGGIYRRDWVYDADGRFSRMLGLFWDRVNSGTRVSQNFLLQFCERIVLTIVRVLILSLGLITFGLLWPPQVKRWLFATDLYEKDDKIEHDILTVCEDLRHTKKAQYQRWCTERWTKQGLWHVHVS